MTIEHAPGEQSALERIVAALHPLQAAELDGDEHRMLTVATALAIDGLLLAPRHVYERNRQLYLRLDDTPEPSRFRFPTVDGAGAPIYRTHAVEGVDLAAIEPRLPDSSRLNTIASTQLAESPMRAGEPIIVAGYHPDVAPDGTPTVVVLRAAVAVGAGTGYAGGHGFLIDCTIVPGMSGSIVLREVDDALTVAGIVEGFLPTRRYLIDPRTGRPAELREESTGFAIVVDATAIRQLLDASAAAE